MNMKITTETGREMLRSVTPIYNQDDLALAIFEANGKVMEEVGAVIEELKYELFPQNATWTLPYWEQKLGIKHKKKLTTAERVQEVIFELNKYFPVTRLKLEQVVNLNVQYKNAKVIEDPGEYSFTIMIPASNHLITADIHKDVEELKPAHLAYLIAVTAQEEIILTGYQYDFNVPIPICNTFHTDEVKGGLASETVSIIEKSYGFEVLYPICNTFVTASIAVENQETNVFLAAEYRNNDVLFKRAGTIYAGEGDI